MALIPKVPGRQAHIFEEGLQKRGVLRVPIVRDHVEVVGRSIAKLEKLRQVCAERGGVRQRLEVRVALRV